MTDQEGTALEGGRARADALLRRGLGALFVLSGSSGLAFEVLWTRQLSVVVGGTHRSVAFVVALFMAGLGAGSLLASRRGTRAGAAARAYGLVELGIALCAALTTLTLPRLEALGSGPLRVGLASLLVLAPTTLMGATLPLMTRAWDSTRGEDGARSAVVPGTLYALNTAGAVLGCLLAGFVAVGALGVRVTGLVGAVINGLCGLGALSLHALSRPRDRDSSHEPRPGGDARSHPLDRADLALALSVSALAGAAALSDEILWVRALLPYVNSSTYAFSAILATYLTGLAVGSALVAPRATPERAAPSLAGVQVAVALVVCASPLLLRAVDHLVPAYVGVQRARTLGAWLGTVAGVFGKTSVVVLPPALLLGATTPLCVALASKAGLRGGARAGLPSAANTAGAIAGSLLAGMVVLPAVGVVRGLAGTALVHVAIAALALWRAEGRRVRAALTVAVAAALVLALGLGQDPTPFVGRTVLGWRVLLIDEGPQDTTAVVERSSPIGPIRGILSNGVQYAGDAPLARRYMSLLGHLPALLSRDPSRAMVICVGTGTTAAALASHPSVRALDLVDISPAVHRTLPLFTRVNGGVWRDPRAVLHEADGRRFLVGHRARYGVISLEPPPPRMAGAASLYTLELYERAREALVEGGVIAQWIPLHGMTAEETRMLVRTFLRVFPDAAFFLINHEEGAVVGRKGSGGFSASTLRAGVSAPSVAESLRTVGLRGSTPEALSASVLALGLSQGEALSAWVGPGPIVRDDRPLIEYFAWGLERGGDRWSLDGRLAVLRALASQRPMTVELDGPAPPSLPEASAAVRGELASLLR